MHTELINIVQDICNIIPRHNKDLTLRLDVTDPNAIHVHMSLLAHNKSNNKMYNLYYDDMEDLLNKYDEEKFRDFMYMYIYEQFCKFKLTTYGFLSSAKYL